MKACRATIDELRQAMRTQLEKVIQEALEEVSHQAGIMLCVQRLQEFAEEDPLRT